MRKGGSIVQVQTNRCNKGQTKENKEGDIVTYLLPRAKVRPISKHKQIKTSNTKSWFYSNHHTDSTAHRGYTTHPTLGVLGCSRALLRASCSLLGFPQVLLRLLQLFDETIRVEPEDSSTTSRLLK